MPQYVTTRNTMQKHHKEPPHNAKEQNNNQNNPSHKLNNFNNKNNYVRTMISRNAHESAKIYMIPTVIQLLNITLNMKQK